MRNLYILCEVFTIIYFIYYKKGLPMKHCSLFLILLPALFIFHVATAMKPKEADTLTASCDTREPSKTVPSELIPLEDFKKIVSAEENLKNLIELLPHFTIQSKLFKFFKIKRLPDPARISNSNLARMMQIPFSLCNAVASLTTSENAPKRTPLSDACGISVLTPKDAFPLDSKYTSKGRKQLKDPLHASVLSLLPKEARAELTRQKDIYLNAYHSGCEWSELSHSEKKIAGCTIYLHARPVLAPCLQKHVSDIQERLIFLKTMWLQKSMAKMASLSEMMDSDIQASQSESSAQM